MTRDDRIKLAKAAFSEPETMDNTNVRVLALAYLIEVGDYDVLEKRATSMRELLAEIAKHPLMSACFEEERYCKTP